MDGLDDGAVELHQFLADRAHPRQLDFDNADVVICQPEEGVRLADATAPRRPVVEPRRQLYARMQGNEPLVYGPLKGDARLLCRRSLLLGELWNVVGVSSYNRRA